mmetsp:Transcript_77832/g.200389  ORF Transcript_77832/g.200389 Transcript_77832/m.200389 type:complete len:208 (-) Transcript_77832:435-1058(-)
MSICGSGAGPIIHSFTLAVVPFQSRHITSFVSSMSMQACESTHLPCTVPAMGSHLHPETAQADLGKGAEESKTATPLVWTSTAPTKIAAMFRGRPVMKKSLTRSARGSSCDFASTTTLAGVAVGSRNENEQATVAGSMRASGFVMAVCAAEPSTGSIAAAVPIAEKHCAMAEMTTMIRTLRPKSPKSFVDFVATEANLSPIQMFRPD